MLGKKRSIFSFFKRENKPQAEQEQKKTEQNENGKRHDPFPETVQFTIGIIQMRHRLTPSQKH